MPNINITRIAPGYEVPIPPCLRVSDLARAIETRAYEIFLERGGSHGNSLDDWMQAEREKSGHARANLYEDDAAFRADFQVPGFEPDDIQVAISAQQLGIHARRIIDSASHSGEEKILHEFSEGEAYRQLYFSSPVDPETIEIQFEDGVLHVSLSKAQGAGSPEEDQKQRGASA